MNRGKRRIEESAESAVPKDSRRPPKPARSERIAMSAFHLLDHDEAWPVAEVLRVSAIFRKVFRSCCSMPRFVYMPRLATGEGSRRRLMSGRKRESNSQYRRSSCSQALASRRSGLSGFLCTRASSRLFPASIHEWLISLSVSCAFWKSTWGKRSWRQRRMIS